VLNVVVQTGLVLAQGTNFDIRNGDSPLADVTGDGKITVLGFGDSLTYGVGDGTAEDGQVPFTDGSRGYLPRLAEMLGVLVINEGSPGEVINPDGIERLPGAIKASNADVVIIMEGYNDARSGLSAEQYRRVLQRAVNVTKSLGRIPVLMSLVKTTEDHSFLLPYIRPYSKVTGLLASANGTVFADLFQLWSNNCPKDGEQCSLLNTPEGLHPTPLGYRAISQAVGAALLDINILTPEGIVEFADATGISVDQVVAVPSIPAPTVDAQTSL
jgi:lysophospholipase L1-like esterase